MISNNNIVSTNSRSLQDRTFTVAAGARVAFEAYGNMFQLAESTGTLTIKTSVTAEASFSQRQGVRFDGFIYERIEIKNETGSSITARILFGFGEFVDGTSAITGAVTVTQSALPTGASTEAKQDTANASLASIDGKLTAPLSVTRVKVGVQNNAWNAAVVGVGGTSNSVDAGSLPFVSAFGNADAATTVSVQVSEDNISFFTTGTNQVLAGAGDFHVSLQTGAGYIRLISSAAATISATIAAKG